MTEQVENTGTIQKNLKLTIDDNTYEKHVSNIAWNPSSTTQNWQGGTPDSLLTDTTPSTWVAAWTILQDWQNPDSLINWVYDHQGEKVEVEYMPDADGDVTFTATVTIPDINIGGAVNAFNESTFSGPSTKPDRSTTSPVIPTILELSAITAPAAGGAEIEIHGTDFRAVSQVKFGASNATSFDVVSPLLIVATVPAHAAGAGNVSVVNAAGTSPASPFNWV
jgi:hypothetical protein